jgi:hypothetical protein
VKHGVPLHGGAMDDKLQTPTGLPLGTTRAEIEIATNVEKWAIGRRLAFEGVKPTSAAKNATEKTNRSGGRPVDLSQDEREALRRLTSGETTSNVDEYMVEKSAVRGSATRRSWRHGDAGRVKKAWRQRGSRMAELS